MQFTKDELKALAAILEFAEPLLSARDCVVKPSTEGYLDIVSFPLEGDTGAETLAAFAEVRELVDVNGLKALGVKALDMLSQATTAAKATSGER